MIRKLLMVLGLALATAAVPLQRETAHAAVLPVARAHPVTAVHHAVEHRGFGVQSPLLHRAYWRRGRGWGWRGGWWGWRGGWSGWHRPWRGWGWGWHGWGWRGWSWGWRGWGWRAGSWPRYCWYWPYCW